jgi:hypothetical protein
MGRVIESRLGIRVVVLKKNCFFNSKQDTKSSLKSSSSQLEIDIGADLWLLHKDRKTSGYIVVLLAEKI